MRAFQAFLPMGEPPDGEGVVLLHSVDRTVLISQASGGYNVHVLEGNIGPDALAKLDGEPCIKKCDVPDSIFDTALAYSDTRSDEARRRLECELGATLVVHLRLGCLSKG